MRRATTMRNRESDRPSRREQEIPSRLDPKGEMSDLMDTFAGLIDSRVGRVMLRLLKAAGLDFTQLQEPNPDSGAGS